MRATAKAHPNIALVKYWGKRNVGLNIPGAGSFSLTLAPISTVTTVELGTGHSSVVLDGTVADDSAAHRALDFVALVCAEARAAGVDAPDPTEVGVSIETRNDFPTAAGLASSSSGFAALTVATTAALGWKPSDTELSILARRGSGSAARSIFGGWVEMHAGCQEDGRDAFATAHCSPDHFDVRCLIALTTTEKKKIGSTAAMNATRDTSPYHDAWLHTVTTDVAEASSAVVRQDFDALARVAERSCLRMHANAMAADPGILYWNQTTTTLIHEVRSLRERGLAAFFTIDAGPHVKVFSRAEHAAEVEARLAAVAGVEGIIVCHPGPDATVVSS